MATTSVPHRCKYDVFVSFRGDDIRKSFMDHMFNDFMHKGIHAFRDDRELPKGEEISPHLYKAIEESRFLIVIFSKNYASSTWCLRELVKILECKQTEDPKHEVRIIFYDAKPDVARNQKKSYAQAFRNHEVSNSTEAGKWKEALYVAANLSGWDLEDMTNGYEYKVDNVTQVQMQMIGKILKTEDLKISSVGEGTVVIKQRMACKRILLVLDNVNSVEQLTKAMTKLLELLKTLGISSEKNVLDIACAFIVENKDFSASVLDSGHCPTNAIIEVLADKFLITVSKDRLQMHELIQSMAREIIREEFKQNHKILWISSEDYDVLNVKHGLPLKFLPSDFNPENIVTIDMSYSHIKHLWTTTKCFRRLKFMKLRDTCLKSFPSNLEMDSLQILILSVKLRKLPEVLGGIKSLTELHIDRTSIKELPLFGQQESI
ncbi:NB-ARC domains-containing protein [Tanacetum coccineum]